MLGDLGKLPWGQGNLNCELESGSSVLHQVRLLRFMCLVFSHNGPVIASLQSAAGMGAGGGQAARRAVQDGTPDTR